jgi:serine/threonine protein kinase/Tol biopolymer transport system component
MSTVFSSGDTLGHYVISEPLGAGGMGEVYRATDTRLEREVAIKVLPEEFAEDSERLARFDREAKALASLSHPNIATLYGLEQVSKSELDQASRPVGSGNLVFLVMELVEGDDLSQRIAKGPLPINTAVAIGRQIAEGLEAAHRKAIVHRDLKPANIRVSADGKVKILDFGLAKTWDPSPSAADFTESPTVTAGMTRRGTILGTAPYLSPEQARGQVVDRQTDIWAFGCVLYEMLAGRQAFSGGTSSDLIVDILEHEPDWDALDHNTPMDLRRLVGRCLEKEPIRRLRDAGDVALALEDLDFEDPRVSTGGARPVGSPTKKLLPWLVSAVAVILAVIVWMGRSSSKQPQASPALHFTELSPAALDISRIGHYGSAVAVSPDGHVLVWVGANPNGTQLYARHLDEDQAHPIAGTEGGLAPFFSPDGVWIGFWADEKLKKVAVRGGAPQTICEVGHVHGASWGDGIIVMDGIGAGMLSRVDPRGGPVERIEVTNRPGYLAGNPRLLPGSDAMLVSTQDSKTVDLVSLTTGEVTTLVSDGNSGTYLPSGHLLWIQGDNLLAAPFDLSRRTITGDAYTVIEGVLTETDIGSLAHYAVSNEGTLAYLPGTAQTSGTLPTWVALDGTTEPMSLPPESYLSPRVSPDGQKLLLSRQTKSRSLWLAEPARGVISPVTDDESNQYWAIWTPDGDHMIFNSQEGNEPVNLWVQRVDHSKPARRLTTTNVHHVPMDITRDGRTVLFLESAWAGGSFGIKQLHIDGEPRTTPLLATSAHEVHPKLSPDDRWLAYASDVTGRMEIYVQRFPDLGATVRVSPKGGVAPLWSPSGDRLYYRSENGRRVFAVDVTNRDPIQFGGEKLLFEGRFEPDIPWGRKWDIHPDGDRFLMLQIGSSEPVEGIRVIVNWFDELERLVPSKH